MSDLFENRYNALRSEYDIGRIYLNNAVIALEECAKQVELELSKDLLNRTAEELKITIKRIESKCGYDSQPCNKTQVKQSVT